MPTGHSRIEPTSHCTGNRRAAELPWVTDRLAGEALIAKSGVAAALTSSDDGIVSNTAAARS